MSVTAAAGVGESAVAGSAKGRNRSALVYWNEWCTLPNSSVKMVGITRRKYWKRPVPTTASTMRTSNT